MRIGLSYHGGDGEYDAYTEALHRRARTLGLEIETHWLAGSGLASQLDAIETLDGIVLTGGADVEPQRYGFADTGGLCKTDRERDAAEWEILERLLVRPMPTLAICRGAQLVNVFHGGTLIADLAERNALHKFQAQAPHRHAIRIAADSRLHMLAQATTGTVNSSHHQAVDRLADRFRLAAVSEDGVIEAFEAQNAAEAFVLAVQWHPESMAAGERLGDTVLDALLRAAN